jgi:catechol 2,3-dioxygenase-like lactoylglutathione lyase family enzyme
MFLGTHHINYVVSDLDKTIPFYRDVLGFKLVQDVMRENIPSYDEILGHPNVKLRVALFQLPNVDVFLELFQCFSPEMVRQPVGYHYLGSSHTAYEVDDIDAEYQRITQQGFSFINEPVDVMRDAKFVARTAYLKDPDGIVIELFQCSPDATMIKPERA